MNCPASFLPSVPERLSACPAASHPNSTLNRNQTPLAVNAKSLRESLTLPEAALSCFLIKRAPRRQRRDKTSFS